MRLHEETELSLIKKGDRESNNEPFYVLYNLYPIYNYRYLMNYYYLTWYVRKTRPREIKIVNKE